ncbi:low molecular weight protein tyrosine phosphatase family protein [Inquilinus limosus]|uniref:Protein tyrosine phosphatase n=1 Tax=Inquilinus limosus TaxID=171674 RepID=A0A211ZU29_9PROT|nr:low molecular weight protein tyrosine phosphatase family protein [Inquilinus limosus]OWJ68686.1 protein tyrosine phosphatase [Inquilinus limosus]
MKRVLFVCGRNLRRSPTAEAIFADAPGAETASAGLNPDAEEPLTVELVEWADLIFVMETAQRAKLSARFRGSLKRARVICLDIPDRFEFMDPELVRLLRAKVTPLLR